MLAVTWLLACASTALAQAVPPPGTVRPPTREEIEQGVERGVLEGTGEAVDVEAEAVERAPCPLASPEFAGIRFRLDAVEFAGAEAAPEQDLTGAWRPFAGQEHPVAVICEIRDRAATQLRRAGYLAAVQVPPQEIADGRVRLDVLFARLSRIQVKGNAGPSEGLLVRYLDNLRDDEVFNLRRAERYLLLARDIPGLDVRLALRPAEGAPGEVIGEVSVLRQPFFADTIVQNYGSKAIGRWSGLLRGQFNGLTGLGDATTFSVFSTAEVEEQIVLQAGHEFRVGGEGLTFRGDFTYGWTRPDVGGNRPFDSRTLVATAEAQYPFVRRQSENLFGAVGFELIDQDVDFSGLPLNRDRLRVAFARLDASAVDPDSIAGRGGFTAMEPRWSVGASLEARHGLDVFDATESCASNPPRCLVAGAVTPTRLEGTAQGFVLRAAGELAFRPQRGLALVLEPRAQYSPDALLSYEEFSAGNYTAGRGYDPGTIIGDSGIGFRSEVRIGSAMPRVAGGTALQPYGFFDAAWVWNEDAQPAGVEPQKLFSAGAGVRATILDAMRLDTTMAVPLQDTPGQQAGDVRFLLNVSLQLAPWRF